MHPKLESELENLAKKLADNIDLKPWNAVFLNIRLPEAPYLENEIRAALEAKASEVHILSMPAPELARFKRSWGGKLKATEEVLSLEGPGYSVVKQIDIQPDDIVMINLKPSAWSIANKLFSELAYNKGIYEIFTFYTSDNILRIDFSERDNEQLEQRLFFLCDILDRNDMKGRISIGYPINVKWAAGVDDEKMSKRGKVWSEIESLFKDIQNWTYTELPTKHGAEVAGLEFDEFVDFYISTALKVDYEEMALFTNHLESIFNHAENVRIIAEETDISFNLQDPEGNQRKGLAHLGKRNLPDGEFELCPYEFSTRGHITFNVPIYHRGALIQDAYLEFGGNGEVVNADASTGLTTLLNELDADKGARFVGEFGIGANKSISSPTKSALFDEKMFGTIHIALGNADTDACGTNESGVHLDLILDLLKSNTTIYADEEIVYQNGSWEF